MDLLSCPACEASYYVESVSFRAGWPCRKCDQGELRLLVRNLGHLPLGALPYDNGAAAAAAAAGGHLRAGTDGASDGLLQEDEAPITDELTQAD
jgi:hypothetical protein